MTQKILRLSALMLCVFLLSGCGILNAAISLVAPDVTAENDLPHLMVQQIDVEMHPANGSFGRHYQSQENLTTILRLLRDMVSDKYPEEQPDLEDGQNYYTVTATYASGEQQVYYVLGYQFLKVGEEDWCEISFDNAMKFADYLQSHPSENGTYIPPATLPPETEPTEAESTPEDAEV